MERVEEEVVGGEVEAEAVATAAGVERQEPRGPNKGLAIKEESSGGHNMEHCRKILALNEGSHCIRYVGKNNPNPTSFIIRYPQQSTPTECPRLKS